MSIKPDSAPTMEQAATYRLDIGLPDEAATSELGRELSLFVRPGDWLLLSGDLGAGKSTLARAFIRALAPESGDFEVPSPTFTLVQPYDFTRVPAAHADLYRIADPAEIDELGLEELAQTHVILVEWPDRLPALPPDRLEITLQYQDEGRRALLEGHGDWAVRLARLAAVREFFTRHYGQSPMSRRFLQGDASTRRYERVSVQGHPPAILMDMPARPSGLALRNGRAYDETAHLAQDIRAVWAINEGLRRAGYSAPRTYAHDFAAGLMLMEDLGDAVFGRLYGQGLMVKTITCAVDLLLDMADREWPRSVRLPGGGEHVVPPYDDEALAIETGLLTEWFWPHLKGDKPPQGAVREYADVWRSLFPLARHGRPLWTLRDFHSPNLIWLPEREGVARVGLVDTQDCVIGPAAYDLVSLLQDARCDILQELEQAMLTHYVLRRLRRDAGFDAEAFLVSYAVLGAQRACKVLGIFARLAERDGKPAYLAHIPRVTAYLVRNLENPALASLMEWFRQYLPEVLQQAKDREAGA